MGLSQAAKVLRRTDFQHLHARGDQLDHRLEALVVQRVGQQAFGWVVGGHQHQHAALEQGLEQAADEHRIADIVHMEFVETQHSAAGQQLVQSGAQGIVMLAVQEHALVQPGEEGVEMHALLLGDGQCLEKSIQQPAFATPHRAMQVQAARGLAVEQVLCLAIQGGNRPDLPITEGIALLFGLFLKIRRDRRGVRGVGFFTQQALEQGKHGQE